MRTITTNQIMEIHNMILGVCNQPQNGFRQGQNLGFIDTIMTNEIFGQTIYPTVYHQAAAIFFYIVKNHTFQDGNKRTGLITALTFLQINGVKIGQLNNSVANTVVAFAGGINNPETVIPQIAQWFATL